MRVTPALAACHQYRSRTLQSCNTGTFGGASQNGQLEAAEVTLAFAFRKGINLAFRL